MVIPKTIIIIMLLSWCSIIGYSQGEWNNWYFGVHAGITFNSGNPVSVSSPFTVNPGILTACISDSLGNFLFYSDGVSVYNKNYTLMPNGGGIFGISSVNQPAIVFPMAGETKKYYLFTATIGGFSLPNPGLRYSIIDMNLEGGLGDIVPGMKNLTVPLGDSVLDQLTAVRHHNNRDVWVVARRIGIPSTYVSYLVTTAGISPPVVSSTIIFGSSGSNDGHLRISPDGSKLVCSSVYTEICNFNDKTGVITPLFFFLLNPNFENYAHGAEFSIDSKYLYFSELFYNFNFPHYIYQFDAQKSDSLEFMQSKVIVGSSAGGSMHMGPDGKIYIDAYTFTDSLSIINNPSSAGVFCNFQLNAVSLNGNVTNSGLSAFVQKYNLYIHHEDQCLGLPLHFSSTIWPPADSIHWDFGDPGSGAMNTASQSAPLHLYTSAGTYTVTLFVRHNDKRTDTAWQTVYIFPTPAVSLGSDQIICYGNSTTFDAGYCNGCSYRWEDITTGNPNIGNNQTYTAGTAGIYAVLVTNTNNCIGRDTIQLSLTTAPTVTNSPLSKTICSGESTAIPLTASVPGVMFHWTASLASGTVTGFTADSGLAINQTLINTVSTSGVVTYRITPKVGECVGTAVDFPVTVTPGNPVGVSITGSSNNVCAGTTVTFTATAINGGTMPSYQWKMNGINAGINSPTFTYIPANGDQVLVICNSSLVNCISNNPATSNAITMAVNPVLPVSVLIVPSVNPVCTGAYVLFTASIVNGGPSPAYQWKVNAVNAINANNAVFTYVPANGDIVTCEVTSSEPCPTGNPATSAPVTMVVNTTLPAGISIVASANPFCHGSPVTFTATPVNGGANPGYQWRVNSVNAINGNNAVFSYVPANGDSVTCQMTSNLSCVTGNPATSARITMNGSLAPNVAFSACFDTITTVIAKPFKLKGGLPLGGTYSGPGVNSTSGIFTPSIAGVGNHLITYTYTNTHGCSSAKQSLIHSFTHSLIPCGSNLTDIRDGKVYPTVQIGSQCWMQKNLEFGTIIPTTIPQTDNCIAERYSSLVTSHSSFYQWDELMQYQTAEGSQGLCPPGWHVPSEADWSILFNYYQGNSRAGRPLQDTIINGFRALMSGVIYSQHYLQYDDFATLFWSSTPSGPDRAFAHGLNNWNYSVSLYQSIRSNAFATRCLKD